MTTEDKVRILIQELRRLVDKYGLSYMAAVYDSEDNLRSIVLTDQADDRDDLSEDLCHWYKTHTAHHFNKFEEGDLN